MCLHSLPVDLGAGVFFSCLHSSVVGHKKPKSHRRALPEERSCAALLPRASATTTAESHREREKPTRASKRAMNGGDSDEDNAMAYFLPIGIADDSPPKRRCVSTPS